MPSAAASVMVRLGSCGFATDDDDWIERHLIEYPAHRERNQSRYRPLLC
jgi:hypothetical protein